MLLELLKSNVKMGKEQLLRQEILWKVAVNDVFEVNLPVLKQCFNRKLEKKQTKLSLEAVIKMFCDDTHIITHD